MKKTAAILLILNALCFAFAVDVKTFEISAYRLVEEAGPVLVVRDALSLDVIDTGSGIDLDDRFTPVNIDNVTADDVTDYAFCYMVYGNGTGQYKVEIVLTAFQNENETIGAAYFLVDETVMFFSTGEDESRDGFTISKETNSGYLKETGKLDSDNKGTLQAGFHIDSNNTASSDTWVAEGCVAFMIDSVSYSAAGLGSYEATVKVSLGSID